jgi:hypothetical protein
MVGQIVFSAEVEEYLDNLVFKLYLKDYFGFIEDAYNYVQALVQFTISNIFTLPHKKLPNSLRLLGSYFISYNSNQQTTWYIIFDKYDDGIYITFIFNNHEKFAQYLDL